MLLDVDGCLAEFTEFAVDTVIDPRGLRLLRDISRLPDLAVLINSGRPLRSTSTTKGLWELLGLENVTYSGSHGLEYCIGRPEEISYVISEAQPFLKPMAELRIWVEHRLIPSLKIEGPYLELKGASFAIHLRPLITQLGLEETIRIQQMIVKELSLKIAQEGQGVRLKEEYLVVELRPPIMRSKRDSAIRFVMESGAQGALAWGDARTDLAANAGVRATGIPAYFVAVRQGMATPEELVREADDTVEGVSGLINWLEGVVPIIEHTRGVRG